MNNFSKINLITGLNGTGKSEFIINVVSRATEINNECYYIPCIDICEETKLPRMDTDKEIYQQLTNHLIEILPNYSTCSMSTKHHVKQIVFLGLHAKSNSTNSTIILEYPEIFLHPVSQIKLTEFLINIAKNNVYFFIETNSANIVNTLRIAVFKKQLLTDDVNIVFFKNNEHIVNNPLDSYDYHDFDKVFFDRVSLMNYYGFSEYNFDNNSIVRVKIDKHGKMYTGADDAAIKNRIPKHFLGCDFTSQMANLF